MVAWVLAILDTSRVDRARPVIVPVSKGFSQWVPQGLVSAPQLVLQCLTVNQARVKVVAIGTGKDWCNLLDKNLMEMLEEFHHFSSAVPRQALETIYTVQLGCVVHGVEHEYRCLDVVIDVL